MIFTTFSSDFLICKFQKSNVQESKQCQVQRHDPYTDCLLELAEHHRHKGAAHISRSHLQPDYCRAVFFFRNCQGPCAGLPDRPAPSLYQQSKKQLRQEDILQRAAQPANKKSSKNRGGNTFLCKIVHIFPVSS